MIQNGKPKLNLKLNTSHHRQVEFRSQSAPVESRVLQVANGGDGDDDDDCPRSNGQTVKESKHVSHLGSL